MRPPRLNEYRTSILMKALTKPELLGRWKTVKALLDAPYVQEIEQHGSDQNRAAIKGLRERLTAALAYKALHGEGSLIDRTNPENDKIDRTVARYRERHYGGGGLSA